MSVAVSIKEFEKEYSKIDNSAQEQFEIILGNTCGLFLIVKRGRISFLHQTGREFLIRRQDQLVPQTSTVSRNPSWKGQFDLQESHALMVRICASYLLLYKPQDDGEGTESISVRTFEEDSQESESQGSGVSGSWHFPSSDHEDYDVPEKAGLEKYATTFWGCHCIMADLERDQCVIEFAARLCFFENGGKLGLFTALSLRLSTVVSRMAEISPAAMCEKIEGGRTVLMVAVTSRDVEFIRALLEAKHGDPAINDGDPYLNRTTLVSAVLNDFPELVELLLEDPRTQPYLKTAATTFEDENSFWTAFQFSVWHGKEATNCFLQHKTFLKNMPEDHREGLLLWLLHNRFINHIRAVARDGESQSNDSENSTELALLAVRDLEPISQQTTEAQRRIFLDTLSHLSTLSPMDADLDHRTAVWFAASSNKHIKLLDYLVFGLGLPSDTPDRYGVTPLFNAAVNRATVSIEYLLKMSSLYKPEDIPSESLQENQKNVPHSANSRWQAHDPIIARPFIPQIAVGTVIVNCQDNQGRTPLLKSIWRPVMERIKPFKTVLLLLHHGADPNIQDNDGQTALMKAAKKGYIHVTSCLIKHFAVVNMKDFRGRTALHQAVEKGCVGVAELLLEAGADYRSPTNRGKTPYDYAKKVFPHSKGVKRTRIERRIDSRRLRIARMMEALMDVEERLHQERGQQTSSGETTNDKIAQERRHD
ncbi:hypothetical protein K456DRAFT_37602 [Colletotrichum gloeosporioides 23]|nr:hypothetical protein K456DRAFT_37602 [Colletotrichum gloeosporioides 23]